MQINNQAVSSQVNTHEKPLELKKGEIYRATIKERKSRDEATLQIRGREVQVKFDAKAPTQDRVTVQVAGESEGKIQVRTIAEAPRNTSAAPQTERTNTDQALRSLGVSNPSQQLRQAAQMVLDKGVPLTRESVQDLRAFVEKEKGTVQQRLNTVQAVANKRLEVTTNHLRSVHEALHGRPLNEVLTNIAKDLDPNFRITREQSGARSGIEDRPQVERRPSESRPVQERPVSDQVRQVREAVQREPNVQRAIEQVRSEVVNNPRVDREVARQVDRAVDEARALQQSGREGAARERMVQALQTAERDITRTEGRNEPRQTVDPRVVESRPQSEQRVPENRPAQERPVSDQVRQVREAIQREPNVQRAIEQVRSEVVNNPRVDREVARQVDRAVDEARALQQSGREGAARERMVQALQTAEREIARTEARSETRPPTDPRVVENRSQSEQRVPENRPTQERPVSDQVRQVREAVQREPNVQRAIEQVRSEVVNNPRVDREVARQVDRAVDEARTLQQSGQQRVAQDRLVQSLLQVERTLTQTQPLVQNSQAPLQNQQEQQVVKPTEALKQMKSTVQKEGDFQKATSELRNQIEQAPFERPTKELITKSLEEATRLQDQGRELAARQQLMQSFTAVEPQVARLDQAIQPEMQQYSINEAFQTQQLTSKDLIVQTITEKLAKAQADFKSLQREITRNLDNIQRLTEAFKSQAPKQVKPLLETTIKRLDNAILKSEMMLLTDMKTEKRLMQASSQLAEAKKLLNRGNYQEANRIVQEIKTMIEKLEFKPSDTKVKHFIMKEEQNLQSRPPSQQLLQQFDDLSRRPTTQDFSARQAFELVRGLGLNRDSEVAQMLATGRQGDGEPNQNMKNALMQLMKMEEEQGRVSQQTNQALANITGQQLLSKSDTNSNLQSMFFNLPFLLEDEVRDLQVFVNSRNEGEKVDWENCNLYFLIETKKLGEVGILVTATDGSLSLTIKNDQPHFKERIEPLAELCRENLKEVGYNIASLNFTKLTAVQKPDSETKEDQEHQEKMTPTFTEKGFDFKI
ncbi:hypothetical protein BKP35_03110 [Anaerobacillus arseniciselenatis]|uniref:Flagellar hook-length control protein-like C-terminal domain-containing protein n=1 Tax=Anaerobacillus arseniciselenatis TaxID=85682 RepID=A0A1S2LTZ9_9BACI|nr:hypothetical protein [Anaerobacillus arseniciselenatis]OIJ15988.1 hypothetical protein BKP35_03110 [Anaerobacillus arseniciselenatis]